MCSNFLAQFRNRFADLGESLDRELIDDAMSLFYS